MVDFYFLRKNFFRCKLRCKISIFTENLSETVDFALLEILVGLHSFCIYFMLKETNGGGWMICSVGLEGMRGYVVQVEADVRLDKEQCIIVGLPDTSMKESRERILSNLHLLDLDLTLKKITIHLSPSDKRKIGVGYDCAMLLAVLNKMLEKPLPLNEHTCILGGLSLYGDITTFHGLIPSLQQALQLGFKRIFIPPIDTSFLQLSDDIEIIALHNVQ